MISEEQKIEEIEKKRLQTYVTYLEDMNIKNKEDSNQTIGNLLFIDKILYSQELSLEK